MKSNWFKSTLGEYLDFKNGKSSPERNDEANYPVYGSNGIIGYSEIVNTSMKVLVIGRVGTYCGSVYHSTEKCWVTDNAIIGIPNNPNESEFWFYLLQNLKLNNYRAGSGQPLLNQGILNSIPIIIPNNSDIRIAIGKFLINFDNKIALNRKTNETLEQIAQTLFKSWFIDFDPVKAKAKGRHPVGMDEATATLFPESFEESELGMIPKGWEVKVIGNQVKLVGGGTPSTKVSEYWENGIIHWATPKDFSSLSDKILLDTERKITEAGLRKISSGLLPVNTVLMSSRAPVGYLAIAKIPVAINQGFIAMKCDDVLSSEFIVQWCGYFMDEIRQRAGGTTFAEISKRTFREMLVIVPSKQIINSYSSIASRLYSIITKNVIENMNLIQIRDTLLPKLLSGEITIGEASEQVGELS